MSKIVDLRSGKVTESKPPPVQRIVVITPAQDKLFYFMMGVFCGANWLAAMGSLLRWLTT